VLPGGGWGRPCVRRPVPAAVERKLLAAADEGSVRFVVQAWDGRLAPLHRDFAAAVPTGQRFARIEICPPDQWTVDSDCERLCQIRLCKEAYRRIKSQKDEWPFFFKLIAGETIQEFRMCLQRSVGANARNTKTLNEKEIELMTAKCSWDKFTEEYQQISVVMSYDIDDRTHTIHN
jgi:hypothetical protein